MPPFFYNRQVPDEAVPQHMKNYSQLTGRKRSDGKRLVWALPAQKLLLNAPLLRWYVEHGVDIKVICRIIRHVVCTAGEGSPAHRIGDMYKRKAQLAEVFKVLENSGYENPIGALEPQTNVI